MIKPRITALGRWFGNAGEPGSALRSPAVHLHGPAPPGLALSPLLSRLERTSRQEALSVFSLKYWALSDFRQHNPNAQRDFCPTSVVHGLPAPPPALTFVSTSVWLRFVRTLQPSALILP